MKRVLICIGVGLLFGLLCLIQVLGVLTWLSPAVFRGLHSPATLLSGLLVHGEGAWDIIPYAVVFQWVLVGGVAGRIWHLKHKQK